MRFPSAGYFSVILRLSKGDRFVTQAKLSIEARVPSFENLRMALLGCL